MDDLLARYARQRAKRARPKTPAPTSGWSIAELSRICEVPVRTLHYYSQRKLIEPSEFRGTATRYPRRALLRLLAIGHLRAETRMSLDVIKRKLDTQGDNEIADWLCTRRLPPLAAKELGLMQLDVSAGTSVSLPSAACGEAGPRASNGASADEFASGPSVRFCPVLPGLQLVLADDASLAVRNAARAICEMWAPKGPARS